VPPATQRPPFFRSALSTYATNIAGAAFSFASVLITARALGVSGRGSIAFLTTVAVIAGRFATLGVDQANANLAGREPHLTRALATTSLALSLLSGALAAGFVGLLIALFPDVGAGSATENLILALTAIPVLTWTFALDRLLRAHYRVSLANLAWLLGPVVSVVVNGSLALMDVLTVGTAVAAWAGGQLLALLLLAWGIVRHLGGFGAFDLRLARRMLGFGLKAYAGEVMLLGNYRMDQWLLGAIAGPRQLGLYSVAVAWVETLFFLPTALTLVQRPDLVRASPEEAKRQASIVFRGAVLITLLLAAALVILAPFLCVTLFGESFRDSVGMLRLLSVGAAGIVALKLFGNALTAQRRPLLETAAIGAAFVCIVALDLILIPPHGGVGAAIASSAAYTIGGIAAALIFIRALSGRLADLLPRGTELVWLWRQVRSRLAPVR
jgi:O-antigen/teichoic acid export membrane protein